jgi:hypothetical protein
VTEREPWYTAKDGDSAFRARLKREAREAMRVVEQNYLAIETTEFLDTLSVEGDWIVEVHGQHNCAGGTVESSGIHEPKCGMEPIKNVRSALMNRDADTLAEAAQILENEGHTEAALALRRLAVHKIMKS